MNERGNDLLYTWGVGFIFAWLLGVLGFVLAGVVDLDHLVSLMQQSLPITWKNLATLAGRPAHLTGAICGGIVFLVAYALCLRRAGKIK